MDGTDEGICNECHYASRRLDEMKIEYIHHLFLARMSVSRFQQTFLRLSSGERAQLLYKVAQANSDNSQIGNLVQNLDVNYKPNKDQKMEAQQRRKADNIYFVCQMLQAFPTFKMAD